MSTPDTRTERAQLDKWLLQTNRYPGTVTAGEAAQHLYDAAVKANDALTTEAARVRGETWREAIQLARFGAMELRAMHDDRKADFFGHGPAALQDFADQLEEKAKQADHFVDANNKVSQWSTERPTVAGWYWWRLDKEFPLEVACVRINGLGSAYELLDNGSRNELPDDGEWCPIARPGEREEW